MFYYIFMLCGALVHAFMHLVLLEGFVMSVVVLVMALGIFFKASFKWFAKGRYVEKGL